MRVDRVDDERVDSVQPPRVKSGGEPPPDTSSESDEQPASPGHQPRRGELRIYLGAAPGVGKTFAMLGEAHRRLERGTDLVAAVVETHGRKKTAELLDGIEVIPPRHIEYRGSAFPELDVPAVLARRPQVVLVDELAHTNTPGSKNPKRWMDVEELLDAGISVISTVNVQHLESLNDVVAQITGIEQRETVPDEVVRGASQVELVDITPEALRRRLSHGNVYGAAKIDAALSNYFRRGNLTALRELALLWLADQVDAALVKYRTENRITATWEARERVVVAVTGGPESETLVRRASRIASKSSAELMIVHLVRGDGLAGVSAPQMGKVRDLANSVGATVHTVVGDDVPATLLDFARQNNATQLVIGTSRRSRWSRILNEGVGAAIVQESGPIDVHMVTHEETHRPRARQPSSARRRATSWLAALLVPIAICALTVLSLDRYLNIAGESALFFVGVLVVALLGGIPPRCALGGAVRAAAELFPDRSAPNFAGRRPGHRADGRGDARDGGRCRSTGRRRGQPAAASSARLPGGGTADPVLRLGATWCGPRRSAGADQRDLRPTCRQPPSGPW
jgi:two-component system sensor histidine kinase KdpD